MIDPDFLTVSTTDEREYERVSLGRKEGDVMKQLIEKHGFFKQNMRIDFQGICSVSPYAPKVCLFEPKGGEVGQSCFFLFGGGVGAWGS